MDFGDSQYGREGSYRASWERAVNGSHSHGSEVPVGQPVGYSVPDAHAYYGQPNQSAYQAYSYQQPAAAQPYQAVPNQQAYNPAPQRPNAPVRKGKRRATGLYIFLSWAALIAWAAFIYYMSAHTSSDLAQGIFAHIRHYIEQFVWTYYGYVGDPVSPICHFGEYFILGALLGNALHCHMPFIPATLLAIAVASGYGYTDEIHQLSVAGRMFDLEDWKIDTIAAAAGSLLMTFFYLLGSRREPSYS